MFSLIFKQEQAHDKFIWRCCWKKGQTDGLSHIVTADNHNLLNDDLSSGTTVKSWVWCDEKLEILHVFKDMAAVDVNENGSVAASTKFYSGRQISLLDLHSGKELKNIETELGHDPWTITFSPNSKYLAAACIIGKINIFGVNSGKLEFFLESKEIPICMTFTPDGKYLVTGDNNGTISFFDIMVGKLVRRLEGSVYHPVRSLTFSKDSSTLIVGSDLCPIKLYNVQQTNLIGTLSGNDRHILSVDFSPDDTHLVSGSAEKTVKLWEIGSRKCIQTFKEHTSDVWCVKYSPDGNKIISVSDDRAINIYGCPV